MKRLMSSVGLVLLIGLVGACSSSSKKSTSVAAGASTGGTVAVTVAAGAGTSTSGLCSEKATMTGLSTPPANGDYAGYFGRVQSALQKAKSLAAPEIKADMSVVVDAFNTVYLAFKAANFDAAKVDPTKLTAINTPQVQTASKHVTDWVTAHCK